MSIQFLLHPLEIYVKTAFFVLMFVAFKNVS